MFISSYFKELESDFFLQLFMTKRVLLSLLKINRDSI